VRHGPGAYQTIWGTAEQPTTVTTAINNNSFGNRVKFNVPGNVVGMRWGRANNLSDAGAIGAVWTVAPTRTPVRVCMALPRAAIGGGGVSWTNMFIHPFLHVAVGDVYMFMLDPITASLSYNDAALLAADVTIGNFTYPMDTGTAHNGGKQAAASLFPVTADNGRRYALDVLFLPD
jgi:hypothetical protein